MAGSACVSWCSARGEAAASTVPYVAGKEGCGGPEGGWYYDVEPEPGAEPSKIILCPETCASIQGDLDAKVDVLIGCATVVPK